MYSNLLKKSAKIVKQKKKAEINSTKRLTHHIFNRDVYMVRDIFSVRR